MSLGRSLCLLRRGMRTRLRMFCFPYAGGGASFARNWAKHLPADVEVIGVQYPGRDSRHSEPFLKSPQAIANDVLSDISKHCDLPTVFVGYSLGGLVAYETVVRQLVHGLQLPTRLVVAASRAPHLARTIPAWAGLPHAEFIDKLREIGGTPESVLQDPQMMGLFLPILRADFACAENYSPTWLSPLPCPIMSFHGVGDSAIDESAAAAWSLHTTRGFTFHKIDGGHFFIQEQLEAVMGAIVQACFSQGNATLAGPARAAADLDP
jgi:medium-chain acyl-[acyl-carrier-protein] hydrolase